MKHPIVNYFLVRDDGQECAIGVSDNLPQRLRDHKRYGFKLYAAICGNETTEDQLHDYFVKLNTGNSKEHFRLEPPLTDYLEWLGTRAFAACDVSEIESIYPFPHRFPWNRGAAEPMQPTITGLDQIVPNLRRPQSSSTRILATIRSDSDEWYTPAIYVRAAEKVMGGIDLDPATSSLANLVVRAESIYTAADDGLKFPWHGRVWMNPPYGGEKDRFVAYLLAEYLAGRVSQAVMCLNAHATDTVWFQQLWQFPICFTHHRPRFTGGARGKSMDEVTATTGTAFVYAGPRVDMFAEVFSDFGAVVRCETPPSTADAERFRRRMSAGEDWAEL